jgi:hypothetical protein
MRVLSVFLTAALLFAALPASAGLHSVNATLNIALASLPPISLAGSAAAASSAGAGGAATLPAGAISGVFSTAVTPPLLGLYDGLGVGALLGWPSGPAVNTSLSFNGVTGTMGLNAAAYLLMGGAGGTNAMIPLADIGVNGSPNPFHFLTLVAGIVQQNPYQLGMLTLMGAFVTAPHTLMGTGADNRTAGGAGTLVLVSPTYVSFGGGLGTMASIATLSLSIGPAIPEPGTLLLLGAGVAALVAGRRRCT